jgi:hypothetical protein
MTEGEEQQIRSMARSDNNWINGDAFRWAVKAVLEEVDKLRRELAKLKELDAKKEGTQHGTAM